MYLLIMSDFNETWIFMIDFWKIPKMSYFVENHPVGAKLFHADGQTDMTKLIVTFCNFVNMPKNTGKTWYKDYWSCDQGHVIPTGLSVWWRSDVATTLWTVELGYNLMKGTEYFMLL